jgi:glycosyltransferase involved in cell wall biosynthesis
MKTKIISIIPDLPPYKLYSNEPRPEVNWDTPDGQWVGIWGYDWPDMTGKEILKLTDEFEYHIWQPDLRADKVYSHTFENGLTHTLFPAANQRKLYGFKLINRVRSDSMLKELEKCIKDNNVILHTNGGIIEITKDMLSTSYNIPIVQSYRGVIHLPSTMFFSRTINIFSKFNHIQDFFWLKRNINRIDAIIYQNEINLKKLKKIYKGELTKITSGCDFSFWHPEDRILARKELKLPKDKKIFLCASNLIELKQVDKIIAIFSELSHKYDFLLIIAGHGTINYENYLCTLASDLLRENKIKFIGYIRGSELRQYYNACDLFLSTSTEEGGPVSVMQAFACEIPVISTDTGNTAEVMKKYKCGCLLDIYDYKMWRDELEKILAGNKEVKAIDREIAKRYYHWPNIAKQYIDVYQKLVRKYYP